VVHLDQQWRELPAAPFVAAHSQGTQGVAVVALSARDEVAPLRLTLLDEVLPGHFECGLDRLRAAADEVRVADPGRRVRDEVLAQLLGGLAGEEAGVCVGDLVDLGVHGRQHVRMAMTEAGHRGSAGSVDVLLARRVEDMDAPAACGDRIALRNRSVQHASGGHGSSLVGDRPSAIMFAQNQFSSQWRQVRLVAMSWSTPG
jgi:hypothetical protein